MDELETNKKLSDMMKKRMPDNKLADLLKGRDHSEILRLTSKERHSGEHTSH